MFLEIEVMKFKEAKALFGKNAEAYLKFSMNDAETIKDRYKALTGSPIAPMFKAGDYTVVIQYGDPHKLGGYEEEFTGTPQQIKAEADKLKEAMWRSMRCLGEPYCGILYQGVLYDKNLMLTPDQKTWTLAEYYSAIEKGLIRPMDRRQRARLLSFLHLPDFLTIEQADNSLIYEERFGYFKRAPGQVVLPEGCVA